MPVLASSSGPSWDDRPAQASVDPGTAVSGGAVSGRAASGLVAEGAAEQVQSMQDRSMQGPTSAVPPGQHDVEVLGSENPDAADVAAATGAPRHGVVLFDDQVPGAGWACEGTPTDYYADYPGAVLASPFRKPRRVLAPADLPSHVTWLTNASYDACKAAGLNTNPWIRHSGYLRASLVSIIEEWDIELDTADQQALVLANLFDRVMQRGRRLFDGAEAGEDGQAPSLDLSGSGLTHVLAPLHPTPEIPARSDFNSALREAIQEWTRTQVRDLRDGVTVALRRPRIIHAREVTRTPIPIGPWRYLGAKDLPEPNRRMRWLVELDRPVLAKIRLESMTSDFAPILGFAQGTRDADGRPVARSWASHPELMLLEGLAQVAVEAAWIGAAWAPHLELPELFDHPLAHSSFSAGLLAENWWLSACRPPARKRSGEWEERVKGAGPGKGGAPPQAPGKSRAGASRGSTRRGAQTDQMMQRLTGPVTTPRATWLRAVDRVKSFWAAAALYRNGWQVLSYGTGTVRVSVSEEQLGDLIKAGFAAGLVPPLSAATFGPTSKTPGMARARLSSSQWGGEQVAAFEAVLRTAGRRDLLLEMDGMMDLDGDQVPDAVKRVFEYLKTGKPFLSRND